MHARPSVLVVLLGGSLTVASCQDEIVHTTTVVLSSPDGGTLSGFNCIEDDAQVGKRCLESCFKDCSDSCRATYPGFSGPIMTQRLECVQGCFGTTSPCYRTCSLGAASANGEPLSARANGKPLCAVVDVLRVGGEIECRSATRLATRCAERADHCAVIHRRVHCVPPLLEVPRGGGMDVASPVVDANYATLRDALRSNIAELMASAPDEWVLVRVMSTMQDRSELDDPRVADLDQVIGCSLSCPMTLSSRASVQLELDEGRFGYCREAAVRTCAALGTPDLPSALAALRL
ncbi:MAG: hypothetical protein KF894_32700 [Labilithrix sp.]|nr:hypothetical protein [Labilithrix sp.]